MTKEIVVGAAGYPSSGPGPEPGSGPGAPPARRSFSEADKRRIVAESAAPGATIAGVARQQGITVRLLFRWRQELEGREAPQAQFLSVAVSDPEEPSGEAGTVPSFEAASVSAPGPAVGPAPVIVERTAPGIEVELVGGRRLRFARDVDPETVCPLVALLEGEPR